MQQIILIAVGGSLGAVARWGLSTYISQSTNGSFPWGTLIINLTGSFLIGMFMELFDRAMIPSEWRSFITIGFLGAYTTFSTYTLESVNLLRDGELRLATVNILSSNVVGIISVVLGIYSSRLIFKLFS
jgi:fluoride exporter